MTDIQDIRQPTEEDKGEGSPFISEEAFDWLDLFIDSCDKGCCNPEALKFIPLDKAVAAVQLTLPAFEHTPTVKGTGWPGQAGRTCSRDGTGHVLRFKAVPPPI